jgi:hypothetical protein
MRRFLQVISWAALAGTVLPPALFLADKITLGQSQWTMLVATIIWFIATPLWMGRPKVEEELVI